MPTVAVYNQQGKKQGDVALDDAVFGVRNNATLVHQVYLAIEANAREPWAHSKDRSEVRGGGKKPWKQKGTGRARHGSIRSPLWAGGGVTFGPRNVRNYKQKINKKMRRQAVRVCLSGKVQDESLLVLEGLDISGKTREMATLRQALPGAGKSTIILVDQVTDALFLATRNIPKLHLQRVQDVNVVDLLHHQYVLVTKDAAAALVKQLA
ncbi:50S ribosomal protein L4 [Patescibacteria group bacterium]|nr:50S ribosomal protein L4 [Patescibacteria group bacterium]MBU1721574.1 50S ribosomal protein L4 [Patescibacteria group bacterium]MBU1901800.1 50S ribosomal protein L4 [Patescibacteria group bacterium]